MSAPARAHWVMCCGFLMGSDDLRLDAVKLEDLGDGLDQPDAVPSDVINAADEGGKRRKHRRARAGPGWQRRSG